MSKQYGINFIRYIFEEIFNSYRKMLDKFLLDGGMFEFSSALFVFSMIDKIHYRLLFPLDILLDDICF